MASDEIQQLWNALNQVSNKQAEYENAYSNIRPRCVLPVNENDNEDPNAVKSVSLTSDISAQGRELHEISELIATLKASLESLQTKVSKQELAIDALEQYGRSNCLILHGSKVPAGSSCDNHVVNVLNSKLNLPIKITNYDIDISHQLPSSKNKFPIIVKFVRRTIRNMVFDHKKELKGKLDWNRKLSITESLTKRRLQLLQASRSIFGFAECWSMNGNIYCKFNGQKHIINDFGDIERIRMPVHSQDDAE